MWSAAPLNLKKESPETHESETPAPNPQLHSVRIHVPMYLCLGLEGVPKGTQRPKYVLHGYVHGSLGSLVDLSSTKRVHIHYHYGIRFQKP